MEVDPLASMRCWAIEIELGGRVYEIPALPAVDWWPVLSTGDLTTILDFVVSDPADPDSLDEALLGRHLGKDELDEVLTDAIEAAAGRSLHASIVLSSVANMQWASINGALIRRGFRWDDQPLGAVLDAIYAEVTERLGSAKVDKGKKPPLDAFLELLDNEAITTGKKPTTPARAAQGFESIAGPMPKGGVRATGAPSDNARPKTRIRPRPVPPAAP